MAMVSACVLSDPIPSRTYPVLRVSQLLRFPTHNCLLLTSLVRGRGPLYLELSAPSLKPVYSAVQKFEAIAPQCTGHAYRFSMIAVLWIQVRASYLVWTDSHCTRGQRGLVARVSPVSPPFSRLGRFASRRRLYPNRSVIRLQTQSNQTTCSVMRFTQNGRHLPRPEKKSQRRGRTDSCPKFHASAAFDPRGLRRAARGVYLCHFLGRKLRLASEFFGRPGQLRVPHGVDSNRVRE